MCVGRGEFTLFDEEELYNEYADEDIGTASSNVSKYLVKAYANVFPQVPANTCTEV